MAIEQRSHDTSNGSLPYLFSAASADAKKPAPLVLFLHGGRDRGTDLNVLLKWGLPHFVDSSSPLPYAFAAPQILEEQTWAERESDAIALLDHLIASEPIDPSRVIIAGFSLGTAGAWHIAASHSDRFAGLVAVSGRVPKTLSESQLTALKNIPIHIFQGAQDKNLSIEDVQHVVDTLRGVGGTVDFTVLPEGDHFIADEVYSNPKLQQWLVSLSRRETSVVA
ncbi:prolyl oligopeptidase family serine peptidase [Nostoc sp. C117]|uniref:carboxylesterase family protein n=1 Tax=Nostoc sp. C117 TaxID=3349875 RepID=UPI00370D0776